MKTKYVNYLCVAAISAFSVTICVADDKKEHEDEHAVQHMVNGEDVIGSDLWDFHGNQIGSIEKLLLEPSGNMVFAIVDAGDILEEDRKIAVPWSKVYVRTKDDDRDEIIYTLDATKEQLREAPACENEADEGRLSDPNKAKAIYSYWKVDPLISTQLKSATRRLEERKEQAIDELQEEVKPEEEEEN